MDADLLQRIVAAFSAEAGELLDGLDVLVAELRVKRGAELAEQGKAAMRMAHTLKGGAVSVGLEQLGSEAHALEDLLAPVAKGERERADDLVPKVVEHLARLHQLLREGLAARANVERFVADTIADTEALPAEPEPAPSPSGPERAKAAEQVTLRVEASRLDALMGYTGDLLSLQGRMMMHSRHLESFYEELGAAVASLPEAHRKDLAALTGSLGAFLRRERFDASALARLSGDMGAAVRRIRLIPLQALAPVWRRATLEAAHTLGKQVELRVELGDIEVDKRVLDVIREPVVHLLRNSVSHGIEAPAVRAERNKPPQGHVLVRAQMDGNYVRLEVSDDGAGFDLPRLGKAALAAGRVTQAELESFDDARLLALAFEEGVSTAPELTQVSGRGVGLDVVRRALVGLGGQVEPLARGPLGGAAFRLTMPMDVLSTRVLLVREANVVYGLPIAHVERTARVRAGDVHLLDGVPVAKLGMGEGVHAAAGSASRTGSAGSGVHLAEGTIRLVWLAEGRKASDLAPSTWLRVVVVAHGAVRVGVVVTEVLPEAELVVRPLPWNLKRVRGVLGAASLADGSVAVVLDATALVSGAGRKAAAAPRRRTGKTRVLVVDDSLTHRTLEQNILIAAGYEVAVAPDGLAGWRALEEGEFDLVVSDVEMPGLDGIELTRRVRAHPRLAHLPVVLVTGLDRRADIERGLNAGANEYVVKGQLEPEKLLQAVARNVWSGGAVASHADGNKGETR